MKTQGGNRNVRQPQDRIDSRWARRLCVCSIAWLVCFGAIQAGEEDNAPSANEPRLYAYVLLGGFETGESASILDESTASSSFGAGVGWRFHRHLTVELDANLSSTSYEMPDSLTSGTRSEFERYELSLSTAGILGNVKLERPFGRFTPHIGVGLGVGVIDVTVSDAYTWGYAEEPLSSEFSLLTQVLGGFDVRVGRRSSVGLEYRELIAHRKVDFAGEEIDGGGESLLFAYRIRF